MGYRVMRLFGLTLLCGALMGCEGIPRDPDGTLERIRQSRVIRVGQTAETKDAIGAGDLLRRLEQVTGARVQSVTGGSEPLLKRLEEGELDLVIATFDPKTPWKTRVTLAPPLFTGWDRARGERAFELRAAARNGENAWITQVQRAARATQAEGGR